MFIKIIVTISNQIINLIRAKKLLVAEKIFSQMKQWNETQRGFFLLIKIILLFKNLYRLRDVMIVILQR